MSRARDNANLGAQAGSGLDASDITSGALGASVTGGAGLGVSTAATSTFAPKAGPTFTGTVAIPNVANLETAVVANTAKVTNYNQTLADINALDVTELGTVTSANLSNTAIVYPVGHVIQTVQDTKNDEHSAASVSSTLSRVQDASGNYEWGGTINNVLANSWVLINMTFSWMSSKTAVDIGVGFGFFRGASVIVPSAPYQHYQYTPSDEGKDMRERSTMTFIDKTPDTGTNEYTLGYKTYNSASVSVRSDGSYAPFVCILQEIAQ